MTILQFLNAQHALLLAQLRYLETRLDEGWPAEELAAIVRTIASGLEVHTEEEEIYLYPLVRKTLGRDCAALRTLKEQERDREMAVRWIAIGKGDSAAVRRFIRGLHRHIQEEAAVLFPMIEAEVPGAQLEALGGACSTR